MVLEDSECPLLGPDNCLRGKILEVARYRMEALDREGAPLRNFFLKDNQGGTCS